MMKNYQRSLMIFMFFFIIVNIIVSSINTKIRKEKFENKTNVNLAFYTYFYGTDQNVSFKIPNVPSSKYPCYYITNNEKMFAELQDTQWISVYDQKQCNDDLIECNMIGKYIKACPHQHETLKQYDYLCFFDSKLNVDESFVEELIHKFLIEQDHAMLIREHWFIHENVWDEYNASMHQERYKLQSEQYKAYIQKQIDNGLSEKTKHHAATGFIVRNMRHPRINDLNETWYTHILECGIQCQISFFFVKQLFEGDIYFLSVEESGIS